MTLPNAPRRGKDNARPDHFAYCELKHGDEQIGYLAGPILWMEIHQSDFGSKPCLEKLTGGDLSCSRCKYGKPVQKGACPWWHAETHTPHMYWLDDGRREVYEAITWARKLKFRREKIKGAPVWAHVCLNQEPLFKSEHPCRKGPADITRSLLTMFKLPELDMWYAQTHGLSVNAVSQEKPKTQDDYEREVVEAIKRGDHSTVEAYLGMLVGPAAARVLKMRNQAFVNGTLKPSKNGKHKPPEG